MTRGGQDADVSDRLISVLVRVRNESRALSEVLVRLHEQVIDANVEVVVLDNESDDDTVAVALRSGARVYSIPRHLFGYGRALNLGVEFCRGGIVVVLSAHSVPGTDRWLNDLVTPLWESDDVGAVFCRQVPIGGEVSRTDQHRFGVFPSGDTVLARDSFVAECRSGRHPYEAALFSNSACAVRRAAVLGTPFRDLPAAEDRAFAVDYVMTGGKIAYRHAPWVYYERPTSWKSHYRNGYGIEASKRLIQDLAASYTHIRFPTRGRTASRLLRAALVGPVVAAQLVLALREDRGSRRRAAVTALRRTGGTVGAATGSLLWRRHLRSLSRDEAAADMLRENCRELKSQRGSASPGALR
jgi:glycosyltransferase involved in cell wall biosynthesis